MIFRLVSVLFLFIFGITPSHLIAESDERAKAVLVKLETLKNEAFIDYLIQNWEVLTIDEKTPLMEKAVSIAEALENPTTLGRTYLFLGRNNYGKGEHEKTIKNYLAALGHFKSAKDFSNIGLVYNELSILTKKQRNYNQAFEYLKLSREACEQANDSICISTSLDNTGLLYIETGEYDKAEPLFKQVLAMRERLQDSIGIGFVLNNLAECEANRGAYESAVTLINRSTAIRKALGHKFWVAVNDNNIGEMYARFGDHRKAISYFEASLEESIPNGYSDLIQHTLNAAADNYTKLGDYQNAFELKQQASAIKDSIFNVNKSRQITEMETKYETERHRLEALAQAEKNRRLTAWGSAIFAGLLLIGSIGYFRFYQKQKYERRLKELELHEKVQNERHRISRDLHDNVGAQLTNIITNLDILEFKSQKSGDGDLSGRIEKVSEFARSTMTQLRETIWAINKESFSADDFSRKVREYFSKILSDSNSLKEWEVIADDNIQFELSPIQALNLFRIIQEATNNMIKHANASEYQVALSGTEKDLKLTISDNGIGFNIQVNKTGHYGLENMKHRAEEINADFDIFSKEKEGTTILISLKGK
ncbi:MAG: sensor histidine kinase [Bacteroidota bacterium]